MKAIIPAAGIGKRLQPHTFNRPKVMVPVAGKPILEHISGFLFEAGFDQISVIVGYKKEAVIFYFKEKYPGHFHFPVQEEMKGLGHAVLYGLDDVDEPALIILGDTIIDIDYQLFHNCSDNVIAVVEVDDPQRFGIVETDKNNMITGMVEKPEHPPTNLAIAGVYFIQSQRKLKQAIETLIREDIKTRNEYQLTDALAIMIKAGEPFKAVKINDWYDCGTPETLLSTNRFLLERKHKNEGQCENCKIIDPVYIGEGSYISDSTIGPHVAIGNNVHIENSHISNSMINDNAELLESELTDSIIGYSAKVNGYKGSLNIGDGEEVERE